jgi:type IV pilus assembly protein PilQ
MRGWSAALAVAASAVAAGLCLRAAEPGEAESRVVRLEVGAAAVAAQKGTGTTFSLKVTERPLKTVLEYLKSVSGVNIVALPEKEGDLLVTLDLENVTYRGVLDFVARKYGLAVDDSKIREKLIFITRPERVVLNFKNAEVEEVINTIALMANANIVVGPEVKGKITMKLENVPWHEALNIVVKTLDYVAVPEAHDTIRITTAEKLARQLETRIFRMAYLAPEGAKYTATISSEFAKREVTKEATAAGHTLIDVLARMKSSGGQLAFVKAANALVVTDNATKLDAMEAIVNKLDVAPKQIHVSVKIVLLTDDDVEKLGVNWSNGLQFLVEPLNRWQTAFPFDISAGLSHSILGKLVPAPAPSGGGKDIVSLRKSIARGGELTMEVSEDRPLIELGQMSFVGTRALLDLIRTKTGGRLIQSPHLVTLDNEEATIQVGRLFRYAESYIASTEGGGFVSGWREASGSPLKLGVQLLIIPHVTGPENNILMTIVPKTEDPDGDPKILLGPGGEELLLQDTRQSIVVTRMLLRNGETGVIGGLRREVDNRTQQGIPALSDIPVLGRLFRHRTRTVSGENLMIFVTPTIVDLELRDDFTKQLDKLRQELSKPFAPLGEEEPTAPPRT